MLLPVLHLFITLINYNNIVTSMLIVLLLRSFKRAKYLIFRYPVVLMDILKKKSDDSADAANLLFSRSLYSPSVHCSYFSSLQLAKHLLLNKYHMNAVLFDRKDKDSHKFIIDNILNKIKSELQDNKMYSEFNSKMTSLKRFRIESDYKQIVSNSSVAFKSMSYSTELNRILNQL